MSYSMKDVMSLLSIYHKRDCNRHILSCTATFDKGSAVLGYKEGDFKVAEEVCRKSFAIPMFPELTEEEIEFIISSINEFGGSI